MTDHINLDGPAADAMVRTIESAALVRRRYQFFVWSQLHLNALVPHRLAVCGVWQRQRRALAFDVFQSVVLSDSVLDVLRTAESPVMTLLVEQWVRGQGRPTRVPVAPLAVGTMTEACSHLLQAGIVELAVHGVARPQRPDEVESLFVLADPRQSFTERHLALFDMVMPQLHSTYLRMSAAERELGSAVPVAPIRLSPGKAAISVRERQILALVREGKSNLEISELLGISPLTVKNHVQKILRKLGASNRAQAVSRAIAMNLMSSQERMG